MDRKRGREQSEKPVEVNAEVLIRTMLIDNSLVLHIFRSEKSGTIKKWCADVVHKLDLRAFFSLFCSCSYIIVDTADTGARRGCRGQRTCRFTCSSGKYLHNVMFFHKITRMSFSSSRGERSGFRSLAICSLSYQLFHLALRFIVRFFRPTFLEKWCAKCEMRYRISGAAKRNENNLPSRE